MSALSEERRAPPEEATCERPGSARGAGLRERWLGFRDRLLSDPRFHRSALAFGPTRWIARREARALFDLVSGFVYSQALSACVRVGLLAALKEGPLDPAALASRLRLPPAGVTRLAEAAVALGLAERRDRGRIGLGLRGAALLGSPGTLEMIAHQGLLYDDLRDPVALLRGEGGATRLSQFWPYAGATAPSGLADGDVASYTRLMAATNAAISEDVLGVYPFARHRRVLDLGGGDGSFALAIADRFPRLDLAVLDLPAVTALAEANIARRGLAKRIRAIGGDFRAGPLPEGFDLVTLVRVILDHDDGAALALLGSVRRALPPGGRILLAEPMAGLRHRAGPAVYFSFYLLGMGSGRPRREEELVALLRGAGFRFVRRHRSRQPLIAGILSAEAR